MRASRSSSMCGGSDEQDIGIAEAVPEFLGARRRELGVVEPIGEKVKRGLEEGSERDAAVRLSPIDVVVARRWEERDPFDEFPNHGKKISVVPPALVDRDIARMDDERCVFLEHAGHEPVVPPAIVALNVPIDDEGEDAVFRLRPQIGRGKTLRRGGGGQKPPQHPGNDQERPQAGTPSRSVSKLCWRIVAHCWIIDERDSYLWPAAEQP